MTLLNVWATIGRMLNIERFQYVSNLQPGNEAHQELRDAIAEGKRLMEQHVRNEERVREQLSLAQHRDIAEHSRMDTVGRPQRRCSCCPAK
jgi:hypothetical protein